MTSPTRPHPALLALEAPRALGELGVYAAVRPWLARAPRGDRHPVLVLPGFTASDNSTRPLRRFLRALGYHAHGWRLGVNLGPTDHVIDGLGARLADLRDRYPGERLSIVGWSLGGIYAREIARLEPSLVRQVITLGSPFGLTDGSMSNASPLYDTLATFHSPRAAGGLPPEPERPPLPVPSTAIYTRTDGVAPWQSCRQRVGATSESIEVPGSHCGLGHNPVALLVIADRLAQPAEEWRPFRAGRLTRALLGITIDR